MAALIDAGEAIDAVATRFGVSERHVQQRLRLGKLAPELLDAFRAGEISLEVVTAFTPTGCGMQPLNSAMRWRR
jgi:ParB family chromosome partitioning protein